MSNKATEALNTPDIQTEVYERLVGTLLGDMACSEKVTGEKQTFEMYRIHYIKPVCDREYFFWLHDFFESTGYGSKYNVPTPQKMECPDRSTYNFLHGVTGSSVDLKLIHDAFYSTNQKAIPEDSFLKIYFSPLAFATWISDRGSAQFTGVSITTLLSYQDVARMASLLKRKYGLDPLIIRMNTAQDHRKKPVPIFNMFFPDCQLSILQEIVRPHMHPSMLYKIYL